MLSWQATRWRAPAAIKVAWDGPSVFAIGFLLPLAQSSPNHALDTDTVEGEAAQQDREERSPVTRI